MEEISDTTNELNIKHSSSSTSLGLIDNAVKSIIPRDIRSFNCLAYNKLNLNKYSWELDGERILSKNMTAITREDKKILKFLLLKRSPNKHRKKLWLLTSGARREIINNPNYYDNLVTNFPKNIPSPYEDLINQDIVRTFPDDPTYTDPNFLDRLKNVLLAYSRRNISIGYCQGFNFIAGRILETIQNEEETFWLFVQIIETIFPLNYFTSMAGLLVDSTIMSNLVQLYLPDLYKFISQHNLDVYLNNLIYKWLVSAFTLTTSKEVNLLIWDFMFLEGPITLFKAGLGLLKSIKADLIRTSNVENVPNVFEAKIGNITDFSYLVYYLILRKFEFDISYINSNRLLVGEKIFESMFKIKLEANLKQKQNLLNDLKNNKINLKQAKRNSCYDLIHENCNRDWQLCLYDTYYKLEITDYFVFKTSSMPKIIDDYFPDNERTSNKSNYADSHLNSRKNLNVILHPDESKYCFSSDSSNEESTISGLVGDGLNFKFPNIRRRQRYEELRHVNLNTYKDLLIVRRHHLCDVNLENEENVSFIIPDEEEHKQTNKLSRNKNRNKSFTALHPYFKEVYNDNLNRGAINENVLLYSELIQRVNTKEYVSAMRDSCNIKPFLDDTEVDNEITNNFNNLLN